MDNNSANLTVNGTNVITWTFSNTSDNTSGICQLGSVNFYAGAPDNGSGTYMVKVTAHGSTLVEKVIIR